MKKEEPPLHRYRILKGAHAGSIVDGYEIGCQLYPDQIKKEMLGTEQVHELWKSGYKIWLPVFGESMEVPTYPHVKMGTVVSYGDVVEDMLVCFDRFNREIFVGDNLYVAVRNEVHPVTVVKFAEKVSQPSGAIFSRKMTVRDSVTDQIYTINHSAHTVKV